MVVLLGRVEPGRRFGRMKGREAEVGEQVVAALQLAQAGATDEHEHRSQRWLPAGEGREHRPGRVGTVVLRGRIGRAEATIDQLDDGATRFALGIASLQVVGDGDPHAILQPDNVHPRTATDILEAVLARDDAAVPAPRANPPEWLRLTRPATDEETLTP